MKKRLREESPCQWEDGFLGHPTPQVLLKGSGDVGREGIHRSDHTDLERFEDHSGEGVPGAQESHWTLGIESRSLALEIVECLLWTHGNIGNIRVVPNLMRERFGEAINLVKLGPTVLLTLNNKLAIDGTANLIFFAWVLDLRTRGKIANRPLKGVLRKLRVVVGGSLEELAPEIVLPTTTGERLHMSPFLNHLSYPRGCRVDHTQERRGRGE
jgi:hypothetical protein